MCCRKAGGIIAAIVKNPKSMTPKSTTNPIQKPLPAAEDLRWARVLARDKTADGTFWYSVSTTGVYCRPSCPSRIANPKNVQLHDSLQSAKATGFRPCQRCKPDGPSTDTEKAVDRQGVPYHRKKRRRTVAGAIGASGRP
jgi:methylphosphotriester-DNA--protein-cysteine methyltransferase